MGSTRISGTWEIPASFQRGEQYESATMKETQVNTTILGLHHKVYEIQVFFAQMKSNFQVLKLRAGQSPPQTSTLPYNCKFLILVFSGNLAHT